MVLFQHDKCGRKGGALVAIHERVIAAEIEKIGRSNLDMIAQQRPSTERGLRGSHRRFKQTPVSQAGAAAMRCEDLGVYGQRRLDFEVLELPLRQGA